MSIKAMTHVWDLTIGDPTLKHVLIAYVDHADNEGRNIFPAVAAVAKKTEFSERTVQRATRKLEDMQLLIPDGVSQYGTNKWRYNWDWEDRGDRESPQEGGDTVSGGGDTMSKKVSSVSPEPPYNHQESSYDEGPASPVVVEIYYKDAQASGYGKSKTYSIECPNCTTDIMGIEIGRQVECCGCGAEYILTKRREPVKRDAAYTHLVVKTRIETDRKFHGFSKEDLERWAKLVQVMGVEGLKEWIDLYFMGEDGTPGKRGPDLAYAVLNTAWKYQRAPHKDHWPEAQAEIEAAIKEHGRSKIPTFKTPNLMGAIQLAMYSWADICNANDYQFPSIMRDIRVIYQREFGDG